MIQPSISLQLSQRWFGHETVHHFCASFLVIGILGGSISLLFVRLFTLQQFLVNIAKYRKVAPQKISIYHAIAPVSINVQCWGHWLRERLLHAQLGNFHGLRYAFSFRCYLHAFDAKRHTQPLNLPPLRNNHTFHNTSVNNCCSLLYYTPEQLAAGTLPTCMKPLPLVEVTSRHF